VGGHEGAVATLEPLRSKRVAVLPDLYVDVLAFLPPWPETGPRLEALARQGGGNLPIGPVEMKLGGNAANLAVALARLGAQVDLVAQTSPLGRSLLQEAAAGTGLGMERVRVGPAASVTLALECGPANVMLSHAGPLLDFGPGALEDADWELIARADAVAVVNWAQNRQGTELLRAVAARLRPGQFLYVDTADPRHRMADALGLVGEPFWERVGALGVNENEARAYTGDAEPDPAAAAALLARRLGTRVDLHTRGLCATATQEGVERVPTSELRPRRLTGAGDAWNAGNLAGHLLGLTPRDRLLLAHEVAARYVAGPSGLPPTAEEMAQPLLAPSQTL
jgi:ribokinase